MANIQELHRMLTQFDIIDLTQTLEEKMPMPWDLNFFYQNLWTGPELGDKGSSYQLVMNEHTGTHLDTPGHFSPEVPGPLWIDDLPLTSFFGPCITLDLSFLTQRQGVLAEHIQEWEKKNEPIPENTIVLIYTGWSKRWKLQPNHKEYASNWPSMGVSGAEYLASKKVKAVGVDVISMDVDGDFDYPAHGVLTRNKIICMENLKNLDKMPRKAYFFGMPLLFKGGTGSPIRAFAFVEK